jgi:AraC-like DNA-binding protein
MRELRTGFAKIFLLLWVDEMANLRTKKFELMRHIIHRPKPPLSRFVEYFWLVDCAGTHFGREKIFPDGAIELIININSPQKLLGHDLPDKHTLFKRSWISGERKNFIVIETTPDYFGIGIRFRPGGAFPFLKFPLSEITDRVVEMEQIWGNLINTVRDQLSEAANPAAQFKILEAFLLGRAGGNFEHHPIVDAALTRLLNDEEDLSIKSLSLDLGVSQKHLLRLFDRVVGLNPKLLSRILKFQKVIQLAEQKPLPQNGKQRLLWTQIAYECGYYDQAHMIHDFKIFAGMSPSEYFAQKSPYPNYVFVD